MSVLTQQDKPVRPASVPRAIQSHSSKILTILAALGVSFGLASCGSNLRPTVIPVIGTGPASQPGSYAFVISKPSVNADGIGTVIDYSGDTVMATADIGPGPTTFTINTGTEAYTVNNDGTLSNIPVSTSLQAKNVYYSTLGSFPTTGTFAGQSPIVALYDGAVGLFALDDNLDQLDYLSGSPAAAFKLVIPVAHTPVYMVGTSAATRYYSISQQIDYGVACNQNPRGVTTTGVAQGIETATYTVSSTIPVGVCPVYAIATTDTRRVYVLNRGSDTISVINSQNNALNTCTPGVNQNGVAYSCHPVLPLSTTAVAATGVTPVNGTSGMTATAGPVYANYNASTQQLIVANYDGGTISIIDVSLDEYGNDSPTYGTTYTVKVGNNPASVATLTDGSRSYVANQSDSTVSIVTLASHTVENTLAVSGHPRTVVSTQNSIYGKIYVVSPDSQYITIIRTDQDIISTTVLVQGYPLDARVTTSDGSTVNGNLTSRMAGAGQPCMLPLSQLPAASITIANCKYQQTSQLSQ
jgi:DNA-binding beta-propeller fold protein YncE